ncbi:MAG TPA: hypothetical protein VI757_15555 [Bacteroidia bacterium]|nr:hypothetical protein [Bacteroidia bacterium]
MSTTSGAIITKEPAKFNTYIINTNARQLAVNPVTTNPFWTDYGWSLAQSGSYKTDWRDKWVNDFYPKYTDPLQSTPNQKTLTHQFIILNEIRFKENMLERVETFLS